MFKASSIIQFGSIISYLLASAGNIGWYEAVEERAVEERAVEERAVEERAGGCLVG